MGGTRKDLASHVRRPPVDSKLTKPVYLDSKVPFIKCRYNFCHVTKNVHTKLEINDDEMKILFDLLSDLSSWI